MALAVPAAAGAHHLHHARTWRPPARRAAGQPVRSQASPTPPPPPLDSLQQSSAQHTSAAAAPSSRRTVLATTAAVAAAAAASSLLPPGGDRIPGTPAAKAAADSAALAPAPAPAVTDQVFLDVSIDGRPAGRIVVGLYGAAVPVGAARFLAIAVGDRGVSYRRKDFVRITPSYVQHGGLRGFSLSGGAADAARFPGGTDAAAVAAEKAALLGAGGGGVPAHARGAVSLVVAPAGGAAPPTRQKLVARAGRVEVVEEAAGPPPPNGTEFALVTAPGGAPELDASNLVVGRVVAGMEVVDAVAAVKVVQENTSSPYFQAAKLIGDSRVVVAERGFYRPYAKVTVTKCGKLEEPVDVVA